ncbi:hypothetical protein LOAG_07651 [Loa loa]|uniref:Uncharacterized protein n=1 Tax=Loa loa TaxID=7209 RepID=A0A1S0TW46_LOALO|nr:hypothetical protein LOAG_07651 [Loa loa]EFO20839.1 hypothetical protein LOAG_07651 [Loa loa]
MAISYHISTVYSSRLSVKEVNSDSKDWLLSSDDVSYRHLTTLFPFPHSPSLVFDFYLYIYIYMPHLQPHSHRHTHTHGHEHRSHTDTDRSVYIHIQTRRLEKHYVVREVLIINFH